MGWTKGSGAVEGWSRKQMPRNEQGPNAQEQTRPEARHRYDQNCKHSTCLVEQRLARLLLRRDEQLALQRPDALEVGRLRVQPLIDLDQVRFGRRLHALRIAATRP